MVRILKSKVKAVGAQMREVMFGDLPWDAWCGREGPQEAPWPLFRAAWTARKVGDIDGSVACLEQVVSQLGYDTRHYAQAWHYLRELGRSPSGEEERDVLGVIIESGNPGGLDVLGAYEDHTARYWSHRGTGYLWDRPDDGLDAEIDALFSAAREAVRKTRPRKGPRPERPPKGEFQISFLTPGGIHSGRGPAELLDGDALAERVVECGTALMRKLTASKRAP
jgi:hypothetical protein